MKDKTQSEKIGVQIQSKENRECLDEKSIFTTEEIIIEEIAVDGICGVY